MFMNDYRFIEKRVKIDDKLLNKILNDIKYYNKFTWEDLSNKLRISQHSIRYGWLKKRNTLPLSLFKKLISMHPVMDYNKFKGNLTLLEPFWGQKIGEKSKTEKFIKIPEINTNEFAEFYGIMLGDGCIYSNLNGLCISSNSIVDKNYIENYISKLILNLFGINI